METPIISSASADDRKASLAWTPSAIGWLSGINPNGTGLPWDKEYRHMTHVTGTASAMERCDALPGVTVTTID